MADYLSQGMKRFNYLSSEIDNTYHEIARRLNLSDSAMMILSTICNFGESCLLGDICRLSGVSKQTINSSIRKLESEGVIFLESRQGRRKLVRLTEQGKTLVENTVARLIDKRKRGARRMDGGGAGGLFETDGTVFTANERKSKGAIRGKL